MIFLNVENKKPLAHKYTLKRLLRRVDGNLSINIQQSYIFKKLS